MAKRTPRALELPSDLAVVVDLAVVAERQTGPSSNGWSAAADRSMIDSRRCASDHRASSGRRAPARRMHRGHDAPRRSIIVLTTSLPVGLLVGAGYSTHAVSASAEAAWLASRHGSGSARGAAVRGGVRQPDSRSTSRS